MTKHIEFSDALHTLTIVQRLEFSVQTDSGSCTLVLELAESEFPGGKAVRAEFRGVSNLSIKGFGGGITQLLLLSVEDITEKQLDRLNYEVKELERDSIAFLCQSITITKAGPM